MKRLILIQNDFAGSGKTTLMRTIQRYLDRHQVPHLALCLTEADGNDDDGVHRLPVDALYRNGLAPYLHAVDLVLLEVESGLAEAVSEYFEHTGVLASLGQDGMEILVAMPVTSDEESFDGVTSAARTYGDQVQYAVFHMATGSEYDEDESVWENSKASRLMDLLDGVDVTVPAPSAELADEIHTIDLDLSDVLAHEWTQMPLQALLHTWLVKVSAQFDPARRLLFGDTFRAAVAVNDRLPARQKSAKTKKPAPTAAMPA
ncbi:hypothetical protein [Verrucomicrobium sp. BvORR106]|uniref:hypothetical protein n=1 Tax=Verrucomicrobium sp. BvORR106 TaxID=1403819 RepID=UPI00056E39DE|nr:hypothetical protein [Verrucomicrobium sp. BvORR106]